MTCANCAANIERVVKKMEGVAEVNVNFASEKASISFDPQKVELHDLVEKIEKSGYNVGSAKVEFPVTGMTCANCAMNIERTLNKKVPGVLAATVHSASQRSAALRSGTPAGRYGRGHRKGGIWRCYAGRGARCGGCRTTGAGC